MSFTKFSFWQWFFKGSGGIRGYRRLLNWWILLHGCIGLFVAFGVDVNLGTAANSVLLPLAGILVGLSFAWAGNAQALMQTKEIDELSKYHEGGFTEYVFVYQTAILAILTTMVCWGLAGLGVFEKMVPETTYPMAHFVIKTSLFALSSLTVRECWHVVMGAQWMLLSQKEIKKIRQKDKQNE